MRLEALEGRIDADLCLGHANSVVAELGRLIAAYPLRERFHRLLMLACYQTGRQAEALAAYQRARDLLRGELGVEPGTELRQLHQRILTADPGLDAVPVVQGGTGIQAASTQTARAEVAESAWSRTGAPGAAVPVPAPDAEDRALPGGGTMPEMPVPAQLPADTADFTGRATQIEKLCGLLGAQPGEGRPGAVVITAVAGMGGIGKTALAVHAAHRLRDRFPDGQLFASLQGASSPLRPAEVLARFLRDLGVPDNNIPAGEAERAARYRTLLADRSMLVVLDDARDAAQVRPLLPGTARCGVLVTSRSALPGLSGAALLGLEGLEPAEAHALFSAVTGPERAAAEPEATAAVLAACGGLPLAIRITAGRLAARPGWSIAHLAARLADKRNRLAELTAGDLAVRAGFAVSYDALAAGGPNPARVFRLLGLASGTAPSLPAIAALAGQPTDQVAASLEILTDAFLVDAPEPGRFRLHDLLRDYATELVERTDSADERDAAIRRLLGGHRGRGPGAWPQAAPGRPGSVPFPGPGRSGASARLVRS